MQDKRPTLDQASWLLVRRLIREGVRPYFGVIAAAVGCMILVAASTAATAWLVKPVVDWVFLAKSRSLLWPVGLAVIVTSLVKGISSYGQANLMSWMGLRVVVDMQNRLFAHLMRMDLRFFQDRATGTLISRFTNDVAVLRGTVAAVLVGLGRDSLSALFLIGVMFFQNWQLSLITLLVFPIAFRPIVRLGRRMRRVTANTQHQYGLMTSLLEESIQGIRVVKAYGMEAHEQSRFGEISEATLKLMYKAARLRSASSPVMETLGGLAAAVVVIYGGSLVISGATTPGAFFSFLAAVLMAYQPIKNLAALNGGLQEGLAAAQRLFDLLDIEPAILDAPDARELVVTGGAVRFEEVRFAYNDHAVALAGIGFEVPAGRKVALVGASGAGKSTIVNLIPRFYDVESGRITIDGQDIRGVTLASLRAATALVGQEVVLFDDTVRANILYGRPDASEAELVEAARNAAAHDFIMALPQGYDTVVGEHGTRLSGGQRQRLAIARAMLRNAPILLLDEATSSLDLESERQVQSALLALMKGRTTIVVAHRLSTIVDADIIYVVAGGRLVEHGRHAELLARGGVYARLYALQAVEEPEAPEPVRVRA